MAAIASGLNYSTLNQDGVALNVCTTLSSATPEYPNMPFAFGAETIGLDGSTWVFAKPAGAYAIGTVGYFDTSWNFTALTTTNASSISGQPIGVMSQVASITASPSANQSSVPWSYDGVWVQTSGLCPAILVAASTTANAQLYTTATAGEISSSATAGFIEGIIVTHAGGGAAGNEPGYIAAGAVVNSAATPG